MLTCAISDEEAPSSAAGGRKTQARAESAQKLKAAKAAWRKSHAGPQVELQQVGATHSQTNLQQALPAQESASKGSVKTNYGAMDQVICIDRAEHETAEPAKWCCSVDSIVTYAMCLLVCVLAAYLLVRYFNDGEQLLRKLHGLL